MRRFGHLFPSITCYQNLIRASKKAQRGKCHRPEVAEFCFSREKHCLQLQNELQNGTYRQTPYRIFKIYEPKERQISIVAFRDRVVHHAIFNIIDPIIERRFIADTYACRKGKGVHSALKRSQYFSQKFRYVMKNDIRSYFNSVSHDVIKNLLRRIFKDPELMELLDMIIDYPIPGGQPNKGLPIGNLSSQYFANMYLGQLDSYLKGHIGIKGYLRYMDDFLIYSNSKEELHEIQVVIRGFLKEKLQLTLKHPEGILIPVQHGINFLGFRVYPRMIRLQGIKKRNLIQQLKQKSKMLDLGKISERDFQSSAAAMLGHIGHCQTKRLCQSWFSQNYQLFSG
ncbi:MAG: RNA-dependent DNA polymerase [Acidobacteria bacterium]|nr:MAG: RNA-dependent DNA polymerase [Acidobacteriota bacterium]